MPAEEYEFRLPLNVEIGAEWSPGDDVDLVPLKSGHKSVNINSTNSLGTGDVSFGIQTAAEYEDVMSLREVCFGPAIGFLYRNVLDYNISSALLGLGDDSTTEFQLVRTYGYTYDSVTVTRNKPIYKPVAGTETLKLDAATLATPADYTMDPTTGVITMVVAPASTGGTGPGGEEQLIMESCEFNLPVRFVAKALPMVAEVFKDGGRATMPSIPIEERRISGGLL